MPKARKEMQKYVRDTSCCAKLFMPSEMSSHTPDKSSKKEKEKSPLKAKTDICLVLFNRIKASVTYPSFLCVSWLDKTQKQSWKQIRTKHKNIFLLQQLND